MRILRAEIWACDDCCIWLANGDLSGVEDEDRVREIQDACEAQGPLSANWDSEAGLGIKQAFGDACEICSYEHSSQLHRFAELGEGPEEYDYDGARDSRGELIPIANGCDAETWRNLYCMWAGAYGDTRLFVWADSFDDAFEHLVEWLDDNAPGLFSKIDWDDAAREHGFESMAAALEQHGNDYDCAEIEAIRETAEMDMTTIGHTTLDNGDCIPSWEWGGDEITSDALIGAVRLLSA